MKIAVSGKGGVGKTLVSGVLACFFASKGLKTIAIDADPSPNLALTLGLDLEKTREIVPISENRELVESKTSTSFSGVYRLSFTVDDIVRDFTVQTPCNVSLMVMGTVRSMEAGCTCAANAVIRALLRHMVVERNEVVIVDMEAGVEHLGRGTAKNVDVMLVVTDSSIKSLETAKHIYQLAKDAGMERVFLVGNKVAGELQKEAVQGFAEENSLDILEFVPFDQKVIDAETCGDSPLQNQETPAIQTIRDLGERLIQLKQ